MIVQEAQWEQRAARNRLTLALGVNQLLSWATTFYLPAVIADAAAHDLGASTAAILGGFSWSLLAAGFCAPRVGSWIERRGGRIPLAGSTIVLAIGLFALSRATNLPTWYGAWTVVGAGMALGLYDAAFATAGTLLGEAAGPTITGVALFGGFASTVGWSIGALLLPSVGWRGVLTCFAAVQAVVNLPLVLATIPSHAPVAPRSRNRRTASDIKDRGEVRGRGKGAVLACLAGFFTVRWLLTSAIAAHVLPLMSGLGLSAKQAMIAAMLIGPGQVAGRVAEWLLASRIDPFARARLGALLFPAGALLLLIGGPAATYGFAALYGMSNGIMTINRGTLPLLLFGRVGYARLLGWLAVPVLLAQAAAPTLAAPLVGVIPPLEAFELAGAIAGLAFLLLLPLRIPGEN